MEPRRSDRVRKQAENFDYEAPAAYLKIKQWDTDASDVNLDGKEFVMPQHKGYVYVPITHEEETPSRMQGSHVEASMSTLEPCHFMANMSTDAGNNDSRVMVTRSKTTSSTPNANSNILPETIFGPVTRSMRPLKLLERLGNISGASSSPDHSSLVPAKESTKFSAPLSIRSSLRLKQKLLNAAGSGTAPDESHPSPRVSETDNDYPRFSKHAARSHLAHELEADPDVEQDEKNGGSTKGKTIKTQRAHKYNVKKSTFRPNKLGETRPTGPTKHEDKNKPGKFLRSADGERIVWKGFHDEHEALLWRLGYFGNNPNVEDVADIAAEMLARVPDIEIDAQANTYAKSVIRGVERRAFEDFVSRNYSDDAAYSKMATKDILKRLAETVRCQGGIGNATAGPRKFVSWNREGLLDDCPWDPSQGVFDPTDETNKGIYRSSGVRKWKLEKKINNADTDAKADAEADAEAANVEAPVRAPKHRTRINKREDRTSERNNTNANLGPATPAAVSFDDNEDEDINMADSQDSSTGHSDFISQEIALDVQQSQLHLSQSTTDGQLLPVLNAYASQQAMFNHGSGPSGHGAAAAGPPYDNLPSAFLPSDERSLNSSVEMSGASNNNLHHNSYPTLHYGNGFYPHNNPRPHTGNGYRADDHSAFHLGHNMTSHPAHQHRYQAPGNNRAFVSRGLHYRRSHPYPFDPAALSQAYNAAPANTIHASGQRQSAFNDTGSYMPLTYEELHDNQSSHDNMLPHMQVPVVSIHPLQPNTPSGLSNVNSQGSHVFFENQLLDPTLLDFSVGVQQQYGMPLRREDNLSHQHAWHGNSPMGWAGPGTQLDVSSNWNTASGYTASSAQQMQRPLGISPNGTAFVQHN